MKNNTLNLCLLSLILLALACKNETETAAENNPMPADTTTRNGNGNGDTASLQTLLKKYDPPGRDIWQKPELIIQKMGDLSGKTVADIGAGSGFFSRRLTEYAGKVIAIEIDPRLVHFMDSVKQVALSPELQTRFETRLASSNNSMLKPGEADYAIILNTFIYFKNRQEYLKHLLEVLPEGGRVLIVDFKKKRIPIKYPPANIRLELFEVENELLAAGFKNITSDDCSLDYQYIVIAEK
ncbi:MAG: class I SAM-dependent methyltransferase [Bacteroidota bacterium]